jgi:hypothetical protein
MQTREERFWAKVDKRGVEECWEWRASRTHGGYGRFRTPQTHLQAHRVAWELTIGAIPEGLDVLHSCDNRPCCNPAHLFLGTDLDNARDRMSKGRSATGDRNGSRLYPERLCHGSACIHVSSLSDDMVIEIRDRLAAGRWTAQQLAKMYGIGESAVSRIRHRKSWSWL